MLDQVSFQSYPVWFLLCASAGQEYGKCYNTLVVDFQMCPIDDCQKTIMEQGGVMV